MGDIAPKPLTRMSKKELLAAIEVDKGSHIAFLQSFLRAKSPNPPGDTREASKVVQDYLHAHNINTEIVAPREDLPNIVSDFDGGNGQGPRLVMNGHMDVFPVGDGKGWTRDPWSGDIVDGGKRLHGRGGVDMKAGTAASIIAFAYLNSHKEHLSGSVALTVVSDEETGGKWGSRYLLENYGQRWRGDCMINAEPGGLQSIRFGEKGTLRLTFAITTPGAHGAYLNRDEGANRIAARLINRLLSIEDMEPKDMPASLREHLQKSDVREIIDEIMDAGAADMMIRPTVNIGTLHGGLKVNMIPGNCVFETDIRLPIGMLAEHVLDHIHVILKDFPQAKVSIQQAASNPYNSCRFDHPMVSIIQENANLVTGRSPMAIPGLGATDCKFWRYLDVPAYVFGIGPHGMGEVDESCSIDEFITVIKTLALSAWEYLG